MFRAASAATSTVKAGSKMRRCGIHAAPTLRRARVNMRQETVGCRVTRSEPVPDFRFVGPVTLCPGCGANAFQTIMSIDQETLMPSAWFVNAECGQCEALLIMACPADRILREPGLNIKEVEE